MSITGPKNLLNRPEAGEAPSAGWLDASSQARTSSSLFRKNFLLSSVRTQVCCLSTWPKHCEFELFGLIKFIDQVLQNVYQHPTPDPHTLTSG